VQEVDTDLDSSSEDKDLSQNYKTIGGSDLEVLAKRSRRTRKKKPQPQKKKKPQQQKRVQVVRKDTGRLVNVTPETLKEDPSAYREPEQEESKGDESEPKKDKTEQEESEQTKKPEEEPEEESKQEEGPEEPEPKPQTIAEKLGIGAFPTKVAVKLLSKGLHPKDLMDMVQQYSTLASAPITNLTEFANKLPEYETDPSLVNPPKKWKKGKELVPFDSLSDEEKSEALRQHQVAVVAASLGAESAIQKSLDKITGSKIPSDLVAALSQSFFRKPNLQQVFSSAVKEDAFEDMKQAKMTDKVVKKLLDKLPEGPRSAAVSYFQAADYIAVQERFIGSGSGQINEYSSPRQVFRTLNKSREFFDSRQEIYGESFHKASVLFRFRLLERLRALAPNTYKKVKEVEEEKEGRAAPKDAKKLLDSLKARTSSYGLNLMMTQGSNKIGVYHGIDPKENFPGPPPEGVFPRQGHLSEAQYTDILASAKRWLRDPSVKGQGKAKLSSALDLAVYESPYASAIDYTTYTMLLDRLSASVGETKTAKSFLRRDGERTMAKSVDEILGNLDKCAAAIQADHQTWGLSFEQARGLVNHLDKVADDFELAAYGKGSLVRRQREVLAKVLQQDGDEPYMGSFEVQHGLVQSDADEPYMDAFSDDQSSAMATGTSTSGRKLVP